MTKAQYPNPAPAAYSRGFEDGQAANSETVEQLEQQVEQLTAEVEELRAALHDVDHWYEAKRDEK